ncbi:MATE family efflux transporter [Faecalicatena orotica]|uniref:Probable multidrug resistance protein NorM n=1 Tax=Faecalicatena orotica TaxID=1544 RepID=A0A2Y9BG37_9FIRM|nr:MATE family efflux transporter [Faecalicatena orotica]PWJ28662.1 putative MATE family efflux protein [Faecalicatena orotica]SSA56484.1 putative efflux protein, MATE family [Faecalicatena orotica]
MKNQEKDLTVGSVPQKLIRFAVPLLGANLLQSLYSIADMLVVGRVVGKAGLAAISNASMLSFIINSICIGVTMGGTVLAAQYKGANDEQGQKETIGTLFSLSFIASILVTAAGLLLYSHLFSLLHVPVEAMKDACDYMQIICMGTVFVFGYNAVCSLMKGFGDSKSPLYFVAVASVINVFLDLLLVGPMGMGTKGAAYATILSQGLSLVVSVIHLKRKEFIFDFKLKSFAMQREKLIIILKVGLPAAAQMVIVNISYLLVTGMLNTFGVSVAAASGIGLKVNTFAGMPCWAVGQAVTAMAGQNMGAKDTERVKKTTQYGLLINTFVTFITVVFVQIFSEAIIMLFDPASTDVITEGVMYLRICCSINSLVYAVMYTLDSFAIGVGSANIAMCNAFLDAMIVRLPVCWFLAFPMQMGFMGVYIGQALSPILPALAGVIYFRGKSWETKKLINSEENHRKKWKR